LNDALGSKEHIYEGHEMDEKSKLEMNNYYSNLLETHGSNHAALGIGFEDNYQQLQKFTLSAGVDQISAQSSMLDVGCGLGHLCDFYRKHGWKGKYTGIDINPQMISTAQKRLPNERFLCVDLLTDHFEEKHDYVFCISAIQHRPKYCEPTDYLKKMITAMFEISKIAVSFDIFSNKINSMSNDNLYVDPVDLLTYCYTFTNRLILRNDYRPFQLMVYLYKDTSIDKRNTFNEWKKNDVCVI